MGPLKFIGHRAMGMVGAARLGVHMQQAHLQRAAMDAHHALNLITRARDWVLGTAGKYGHQYEACRALGKDGWDDETCQKMNLMRETDTGEIVPSPTYVHAKAMTLNDQPDLKFRNSPEWKFAHSKTAALIDRISSAKNHIEAVNDNIRVFMKDTERLDEAASRMESHIAEYLNVPVPDRNYHNFNPSTMFWPSAPPVDENMIGSHYGLGGSPTEMPVDLLHWKMHFKTIKVPSNLMDKQAIGLRDLKIS